MTLETFLNDLLGSAEVHVVNDNARIPSRRLLVSLARARLMDASMNNSVDRSLYRHHSEPIAVVKSIQSPVSTRRRLLPNRWSSSSSKTASIPAPPKRTEDRWHVCRNHSDSSLFKAPKRTGCMPATPSVLSTLQRKCSASKVIADMANSARVRKHTELNFEDEITENPESIIEQLIEVPDEGQRRQRECDERFIRSILDTSDDSPIGPRSQYSKGATGRIFDTLQSILGIILIVMRVIASEMLGPAVRNSAMQLFDTIMLCLPMSERAADGELLLPLFNDANEDYGSTAQKSTPSSPRMKRVIPTILQRQDSDGMRDLAKAIII